MPPVPGGVVRNDIVWSIETGAEIAVTSLHALYSQPWGDTAAPDDVKTIADGVNSLIVSAITNGFGGIQGYLSTSCHVVRVDSYALSSVTGKALSKSTHGFAPTDWAGTASGTMLPPSVSATMTLWAFPVGGWQPDPRRWKGRIAMPGLTTSVIEGTSGLISPNAQTGLEQAWSQFLSQITGGVVGNGTADVVVLSRRDKAARKVVAVTASRIPGTQRRRVNALVHSHGAGQPVA